MAKLEKPVEIEPINEVTRAELVLQRRSQQLESDDEQKKTVNGISFIKRLYTESDMKPFAYGDSSKFTEIIRDPQYRVIFDEKPEQSLLRSKKLLKSFVKRAEATRQELDVMESEENFVQNMIDSDMTLQEF